MSSRERAFSLLVVEDQTLIALHIEDMVRHIGGGAIGWAAGVSDALNLIETSSWDAALLDIRLTQREMVYPVAEQLRAKGVPFAFVTAGDEDIDRRYCDAPVLRKPFGEAELESYLRGLALAADRPTGQHEAA
jgi:CheY-like chemotaxis protein